MHTPIPLPLELRDALDDGKVVFFCGAGISRHTGLADFAQLTCDVFDECGLPLNENGKDFPEDAAFRNKQYDRTLHLLENQSRYMRHAVQRQLSKRPKPGSLETHQSILTLSRTPNGGHRVVTTNFDDRFERAKSKLKWQAAPMLEPPRGDDWARLTYLHGRIDRKNDPEGRRLILTSADFARAYLQDGWAARFTQYLFEHYTIVFVGYSLADPVVSYVVDGVAADLKAHGRTLDAYIFADHDGTEPDQKRKQAVWESRGLKPLCFDRKDDFKSLHDTLRLWAASHAQGIEGRIQFACDLGQETYDPTRHDEDTVSLLAWALSKADGSVARAFAEADPPPDISWLEPLSKTQIPTPQGMADLFAMPGQPAKGAAFIPYQVAGPVALTSGNPVTHQMTRWLARHLDKKALTDWVIAKNGLVSTVFAHFIQNYLPQTPQPWRDFWRLILDGCNLATGPSFSSVPPQSDISTWPEGMDAALLAAAQCRLKPQRGYGLMFQQTDYAVLSQIANFEVVAANDFILNQIWDKRAEPAVRDALVRLLDLLYMRLADGEILRPKDGYRSYLRQKLLSTPDSFADEGHSHLVALCLYAHRKLAETDAERARSILRHWIQLGFGHQSVLLLRMALHALAHHCDIPPQDVLEFLSAEAWAVLWDGAFSLETGAYLRLKAPRLPQPYLDQLIQAIATGPDALPDDEDWRQRQIQRRAEKLREGGAVLPPELDRKIDVVFGNMEDTATGCAFQESTAIQVLDGDDPIMLILNLAEEPDDHHRAERFQAWCESRPLIAAQVARLLVGQESPAWWGWDGLSYLRQKENEPHYREMLHIFSEMAVSAPEWACGRARYPLCSLVEACASLAAENTPERAAFLKLWHALWDGQDEAELDDESETAEIRVLNSAVGRLTAALIYVPLASDGAISADVMSRLTLAVSGDLPQHRIARMTAIQYLDRLHLKNPAWTQTHLISRMAAPHPDAPMMWRHFFSRPKVSKTLMASIRPAFVSMAGQWEKTGDVRTGYHLLALALLYFPKVLTKGEVGEIIRRCSGEDLGHFGWFLADQMKKDASLWRRRVRTIIKTIWPSSIAKTTPKTISSLIRIAIQARDDFPTAIDLMLRRRLLAPMDYLAEIINVLHTLKVVDMDFVARFPETLLNLLEALAPTDLSPWERPSFINLLDDIAASNPALQNDPRLTRLRRLTMRKG